jgi:PAS domain S-box-containing protein
MKTNIPNSEVLNAIDKALRELERQKFALDQSAIVAITDIKGDISYVNEKFCAISKYSEEELLGHNHRIINSGYHDKQFFSSMWQTISSGNVWRDDIKNKAKDGTFYWVATTITPFLNESGRPIMFVSIRFDITKQKELEIQLEEQLKERDVMLKQLSHQNKQLEDFCYIISHNLRAPLTNMSMLSDLLKESDSEADKKEYVSKLNQVSDYLQETFDELVSAIQVRNNVDVVNEVIDLEEVFNRTILILQGQVIQTGATIKADFTEVRLFQYPKKYIDSIFLNIISNALKYRSNERALEIQLRSYKSQNSVYLEIIDNGLGLDLRKHGDKLFMLRKTFHDHPQAKGFGLFITKSHLEAMGGKIVAESQPNTYFKLILQLN